MIRSAARVVAAMAAVAAAPAASLAQHQAVAPGGGGERSTAVEHRVGGRLIVDAGDAQRPVQATWVILHRVGSDHAGPVDSVRTDAGGMFSFRYQRSPEDDAIFFLSGSHGGVAYFSGPIREREVHGGPADIVAFDTSSAPGVLRTLGRHVVIGQLRGDRRDVLEAIEISNDTALTIVAGGDERPSWSAILPAGASDFALGDGDVGEGGLVFNDGRVELFAPVAPGIKQVTFGYTLPADGFPISIPLADSLAVLEVLIESRAGRAEGGGLREVDATTTSGRTFRRFLSENAPANAVIRIDIGRDRDGASWLLPLLIASGALLAAVLLIIVRRTAGGHGAELAEGGGAA